MHLTMLQSNGDMHQSRMDLVAVRYMHKISDFCLPSLQDLFREQEKKIYCTVVEIVRGVEYCSNSDHSGKDTEESFSINKG
jgi:hypothetical protein